MIRRVSAFVLRFVPTARLATWLAVASVTWLLPLPSPWSLLLGGGAMAAVLGVAVWDLLQLPPRAALDLTRTAPHELGSGDDDRITYTLTSAWARTLRVQLADRGQPSLGGIGVMTHELTLPAFGRITTHSSIRGLRRGPAALDRAALRVHGPLGLVDVIHPFELGGQVDVVPSLSQVRRFRLLAVQRRLRDAGVRQIRRRGGGMSFDALREYVPGDDPRHIDWKASGRRGAAQVRQTPWSKGRR